MNTQNIKLAEQHETVSHREHTGRLAEEVCSLSLSKSGAIWHITVPKCHQEVQIIRQLMRPPFVLVCQSKHEVTRTRSRGVTL